MGIYISHRGMRVDVCPAVSLSLYLYIAQAHCLGGACSYARVYVHEHTYVCMYMRARAHCMSNFFLFFISFCRSVRGGVKELKERRDTVCGHVFPCNSTHPRNHPTPTTPPSPHTVGRNRPRVLLQKNSTLLSLARYSTYLL